MVAALPTASQQPLTSNRRPVVSAMGGKIVVYRSVLGNPVIPYGQGARLPSKPYLVFLTGDCLTQKCQQVIALERTELFDATREEWVDVERATTAVGVLNNHGMTHRRVRGNR